MERVLDLYVREKEKSPNLLTRRELFIRPLEWLARESSPPLQRGARIPLSFLSLIPDTDLMRMVPVLRRGWNALISSSGIDYRGDSGQEGTVPMAPESCEAVRLFDGVRTLGQVAAALDAHLGMTPGSGVAIAREAFLTLAIREIYHPDGPPEPSHMSWAMKGKDA